MRSTFYGFQTALSGIRASQTALDVTGQNVANVNTEGYTRQSVEQSAANYSASGKYATPIQTNVGQGVNVDNIGQIRDQFLDIRYRKANADYGNASKALAILNDLEAVFNEPVNDGLNTQLADFYTALQKLSDNAGDIEFAGMLRSSARKVTETLNQYADQLSDIRDQELFDLSVVVKDIGSLTDKIDSVNQAIRSAKVQSNNLNELLDMRNQYLDELSGYLNISVEAHDDGTVSVKSGSTYLLDAQAGTKTALSVDIQPDGISLLADGVPFTVDEGQLKAYVDVLSGKGGYAAAGDSSYQGLPYYQKMLDDFAASFADVFNTLNGAGKPLFSGTTAKDIAISSGWSADAGYITVTNDVPPVAGKSDNIMRMIDAMNSPQTISPLFTGTFEEFATSMASEIHVQVNYAADLETTNGLIRNSLENQRESVSGVSVDEETVNVMRFQKAFEASSRLLTALDEVLDMIINRMGIVGR